MRDLITRSLPPEVLERLSLSTDELVAHGIATTSADKRGIVVVQTSAPQQFESRENDDGTVALSGYAITWDTWYDVAGGAPYGWAEAIARGAVTKSLAEQDDVRFLVNHDGLALARTASRTLSLIPDERGLYVDVPSLDVRGNVFAAALASAITRGDVDQMSWAFVATRQEWSKDYTERRITEARIFDVSAVTYPANPATIIATRSDDEQVAPEIDQRKGFPLSLARALADSLG